MYAVINRPFRFRFLFCTLLVLYLAFNFWTTSRYPSLNDKAVMSGAIQLEDPLSFEAHYEVKPEYPVWKKIGLTTLNWIDTNRQGMTFGVLFGASLLTLLGYLRRHSFKGRFANTLAGLGIGAPLGVCVNCAAPIAKAFYTGGARVETTLAAMIASPTLNVVVLTMLFSLLPFYMAVTKIALSFLVILGAVPLISMVLPKAQLQVPEAERDASALPQPMAAGIDETFPQAVYRFAHDFMMCLWFIISRTVPLMLVAGFLGAVVATLLPANLLDNASFNVAAVFATAVVGTFLPVPIGFDVVTSGAMLSAGLQPAYVMTLLFTLGIFSIYSYFVVAGAISLRAASLLACVIVVLGTIAGIAIHFYERNSTRRALEILTSFEFSLVTSAHATGIGESFYDGVIDGNHIRIVGNPLGEPASAGQADNGKAFTRVEAWKLGLDQPIEFSFAYMWPPFWEGRSIASGDYDGDGDIDIITASTRKGLYLYDNDGKGKFSRNAQDVGRFAGMPVFNAALADFDNDGWLDLFITTYQQGNYIAYNRNGRFDFANPLTVANRGDAVLTLATAIADMDQDGYLDIVLGNWAAGWYRRIPGEESRNRIVFNENGRPDGGKYSDLPGMPGETLSVLASDIDGDRIPDLFVANDFEQPDMFYFGKGGGTLEAVTRQSGRIPFTTNTTMSIKSADLHNDGSKDVYLAQIAGRSSGVSKRLRLQSLTKYCDGIERAEDLATCRRNMDIKTWYKSGNNFNPDYAGKCLELEGSDRDECKAMLIKDLAIQNSDPDICKLIPATQPLPRQYCDIHFKPSRQATAEEMDAAIPQIQQRNVLLSIADDGTFAERAVEEHLEIGGWSWDVKIADFDEDGWQDVYVVNGTWVPNEVSPSNIFLHNTAGGRFAEETEAAGLTDYLITAAATQADIDGDGDLDIITVPVNGPLIAFINNDKTNGAVTFAFDDQKANRFGVGTNLAITTAGETPLTLRREIQTGGGFMSFDAPVAHFGIGTSPEVSGLSIGWSDGSMTDIPVSLPANYRYRISRLSE